MVILYSCRADVRQGNKRKEANKVQMLKGIVFYTKGDVSSYLVMMLPI